jgi:hypothetical protein
VRCCLLFPVWRIFSGERLKIVKLSNQKLMAGTAAVLLIDVLLISVWQGVAPLVPVEYSRVINGEHHLFTHCSVESYTAGQTFVALVAIEKAGLLLFGAVMAFSTRNVKGSFNESAQISWTIYNTRQCTHTHTHAHTHVLYGFLHAVAHCLPFCCAQ